VVAQIMLGRMTGCATTKRQPSRIISPTRGQASGRSTCWAGSERSSAAEAR
jgi:hypothetical protein